MINRCQYLRYDCRTAVSDERRNRYANWFVTVGDLQHEGTRSTAVRQAARATLMPLIDGILSDMNTCRWHRTPPAFYQRRNVRRLERVRKLTGNKRFIGWLLQIWSKLTNNLFYYMSASRESTSNDSFGWHSTTIRCSRIIHAVTTRHTIYFPLYGWMNPNWVATGRVSFYTCLEPRTGSGQPTVVTCCPRLVIHVSERCDTTQIE